MNDQFDKTFTDLFEKPMPEADQTVKKHSIEAALAEFAQENTGATRPIGEQVTNSWLAIIIEPIRSLFMNTPTNRMAYNAFGTAAIAFVAVSLVYVMPSMFGRSSIEDQPEIFTEDNATRQRKAEQIDVVKEAVQPTHSEAVVGSITKQKPDLRMNLEEGVASVGKEGSAGSQILKAERKDLSRIQVKKSRLRADNPEPLSMDAVAALRDMNTAQRQPSKEMIASVEKKLDDAGIKRNNYNEHPVTSSPGSMLQRTIISTPETSYPATRADDQEEYAEYQTNTIKFVADDPVSTFSIDVDTASYSLVRNQLNSGYLPKPQAVRAEELINYFDYAYPLPQSKAQPFNSTVSVFDSPWNKDRKLVHIGIKGYDIAKEDQPDSNLVFLLDVSGSMNSANKLPLVKQSVSLLLETLKPTDTVSIVVYAGAAGTVLEPTKVKDKDKILAALQNLNAGGSTAGGAGIKLAYQLAEQNFSKNSVNRIILATDGDFNVGQQSNEDLKTLIERKRDGGVFLSVLGFGRNNYQDDMMQTLAQNGNGVAAYIDTLSEAKKVLVDEATSTLFPIAKDVKIQVEFNPATVSEYRLIGYETRHLEQQDFNNDKVDAGDIGAGHTVTAIYEVTPANSQNQSIDQPRYAQNKNQDFAAGKNTEFGFLKIRYKLPNSSKSKLIEKAISQNTGSASGEVYFSAAVAGFAQLLAGNNNIGDLSYDDVIAMASQYKGADPFGYRSEFIQLVRMAKIAQP